MDTLIINAAPVVIETNYEAVRLQLEADIKQYDIVVTVDTLQESKALATKLNKVKIEIAKRRKEEVAKVSGPLKEFEKQVKTLELMCEEGRQRIQKQVEVFEAVQLEEIHGLLLSYVSAMISDKKILKEFACVDVDDLVKLSAVTSTGNLKKPTRDAIDARIEQCLNNQELAAFKAQAEADKAALAEAQLKEKAREMAKKMEEDRIAGELAAAEQKARLAKLAAEQAPVMDALHETLEDVFPEDRAPLTKQAQIAEQIAPSLGRPEPLPTAVPSQPEIGTTGGVVPEKATRCVRVSVELIVNAPAGASMAAIEDATRKKLISAGVEKSISSIFAALDVRSDVA
jgi:hypothetical protein